MRLVISVSDPVAFVRACAIGLAIDWTLGSVWAEWKARISAHDELAVPSRRLFSDIGDRAAIWWVLRHAA